MAAARPGEQLAAAGGGTRFVRGAVLDMYLHRLRPVPAPQTETPEPGAPWTRGGAVVRTTGKVFFSLGGDDYVCSGSAVSSPDRSTVLTAGHCVYDPESSAAATNWAFVPAYADGKAPYGVFPARHLVTPNGWRLRGDFDVDVAFADVGPNASGTALTDAVGGQPIAFGAPRGGLLRAFGYPAAAPWTGERLVNCAAAVVQDTSPAPSQDQGMTCSMTPGSSGGPWFARFSSRTGRGTLVSVTSFSYSDQPGVLWGPYLGSTAKSLYTSVASAAGV
jgi:V8-like Glu-specific endopeptidase